MRTGGQEAITIALLFAVLCWPTAAFADFTGKVVRVMDGDTLEVLTGGVAVRVRLSGIDCPEKGQAFGQRAKQAASDLAFGKTVEVHDTGRDRYGRTVGEVMLQDGRSLNRELVRAGLAWWYRQYAKKDATWPGWKKKHGKRSWGYGLTPIRSRRGTGERIEG